MRIREEQLARHRIDGLIPVWAYEAELRVRISAYRTALDVDQGFRETNEAISSLGAGATLAGLVTAVPQLVWLSEQKTLVFGSAAALLVLSGVALWHGRNLPSPTDPDTARACRRLRRVSAVLYGLALASFAFGFVFAFVLPAVLQ
jgi:hypothetical protein